jgi:hypothetical protein
MQRTMTNKKNSYERIQGVLAEHTSLYDSVPVYKDAVDSFNSAVANIESTGSAAERNTTGKTEMKEQLKEDLSNFAVALSSAAMMYAYDTGDIDLQSALEYSYSNLRYAKDSETVLSALTIESELLDLKEELPDYNVTEEDLTRLRKLIVDYNDAQEDRGLFKTGTVAANRSLEVLFGKADNLLKRKIDKMVWRFKFDHPNFYVQYRAARTIVDL